MFPGHSLVGSIGLSPRVSYAGSHSLLPTQSSSPEPGAKDYSQAGRLKQEIAETALRLEAQSRLQRFGVLDREQTPRDWRAEKNDIEQKRKEELRRRNREALYWQMEEKKRKVELLEQGRRLEKKQLDMSNQLFDLERQQELYQSQARVAEYRKALDLQRQVKLVQDHSAELPACSTLPPDVNQLVFELPEFQNPVYTIHRPKPVATDPITFMTPRAISKSETTVNLAKDDRFKRSQVGMSEYGQMSLRQSPFREPVHDKHSGLNYRDTRGLLR